MILIFSNDDNFYDRMRLYYSKFPVLRDIEILRKELSEDTVLRNIKCHRPYAVIFDFSSTHENSNHLFMKLNFLKKCPSFKSTPLIALFSSRKELEKNSYLFALGLNYPFIKGNDEKILFSDIHYLAYESDTPFSKFAKAKLNNLAYKGKQIASIYGFTGNTVLIESDLYSEENTPRTISLDFSGEDKVLEVRSQNTFNQGVTGSFLYRSEYEIPFLGPWDEPTSDLILKDSYESWLEENEDLFKQKLGRALVVSIRPDDYILAGELTSTTNFDIYCASNFEETKTYLESYKFDLIFFRLDRDDDDFSTENTFENLYRLTNAVRNLQRDDSIFVTFNSPSRTDAIRKALEYDQVMSVGDDLDRARVCSLISVFEKKGRKMSCETYCYAPYLIEANCFLHIEMNISSITEHELTFYSECDLPMYSVLKIYVPSDLYLLIVPPNVQLEVDKKGNHYMAFIVGGEEADAEILRSFVNRSIVKGLEAFSFSPLESDEELGEALLQDIEGSNSESDEVDETSSPNIVKEKDNRKKIIRKTNHNGKSKL